MEVLLSAGCLGDSWDWPAPWLGLLGVVSVVASEVGVPEPSPNLGNSTGTAGEATSCNMDAADGIETTGTSGKGDSGEGRTAGAFSCRALPATGETVPAADE